MGERRVRPVYEPLEHLGGNIGGEQRQKFHAEFGVAEVFPAAQVPRVEMNFMGKPEADVGCRR
jgi:hypothetical protein